MKVFFLKNRDLARCRYSIFAALICLILSCSKRYPPLGSASISSVNFIDGHVLNSGKLFGTVVTSETDYSLWVSFDGADAVLASGGATWSIKLPCKADETGFWKTQSVHTVTVFVLGKNGAVLGSQTFTVRWGVNKDLNGDGYTDVLVGASGSNISGSDRGIAYVYHGSAQGIPSTATHTLSYPGSTNSALFGNSVALLGDVNGDGYADAAIAAWGENKVYIFHGSAEGLGTSPNQTISYPELDASSGFGYSVSSAGDVNGDGYDDFVVGALQSDLTCGNCGAAYLYLGSESGLSSTYSTRLNYPGDGTGMVFFGNSVTGGGDVNGDGYGDVVVGAPREDDGINIWGAVYVYLGSASGISSTPTKRLAYPDTDDTSLFGWSVSVEGDVNNDGYSDLIAGAKSADLDPLSFDDFGKAYLYLGSTSGVPATPSQTLSYDGTAAGANFGSYVKHIGDVNGDGYDDLAIAAEQGEIDSSYPGVVEIFYGTPTGVASSRSVLLYYADNSDNYAYFGSCLSNAGDTNGDGLSDFMVGASDADVSGTDRGAAYLFFGSSNGPSQNLRTNLRYPGSDNSANFGKGV